MNLTFSLEKKGFFLRITEKGKSNGARAKVQNLRNPNFDCWDRKQQQFVEASTDAIHNNSVLREMLGKYQTVLNACNPRTPAELKQMVEVGATAEASKAVTLEEYLHSLIQGMKTESFQMPSKNYQCYITLLHKLEEASKRNDKYRENFLSIPLNEVTDIHFERFGKYIRTALNGVNYLGLMKRFHSTLAKAKEARLTQHELIYKYRKDMPKDIQKATKKAIKGVDILTEKQYKQFINMDLSKVPCGNKTQVKNMELYRDFCIFLYETKMRPCDLVKLNLSEITGNRIIYWATKKKNYTDAKTTLVNTTLTPIAKKIMEKYKGQSSKGYIFPFVMNEYNWDFKDANSFRKWHNKKQYSLQCINHFLSKIAQIMKLDELTIYTFRHSTFTHKIQAGVNIMQLAKEGGTSVKMLEEHYYNHIANL